jgi:hypothetical protein
LNQGAVPRGVHAEILEVQTSRQTPVSFVRSIRFLHFHAK